MRILFAFQYHPPVQHGGAEVGGDALADALAADVEVLRITPAWSGRVAARPGLTVFPFEGKPLSTKDSLRLIIAGTFAARREIERFRPDWVIANSLPAATWAVLAARTTRRRPRVAVITRDYGWWCPTHVCRVVRGEPYADCGTLRFARTCSIETMRLYASPRRGASYWGGLMTRWAYARLTAVAAGRADVRFANSAHLASTWHDRRGCDAATIGSGVVAENISVRRRPSTNGGMCRVVFMTRGSPGKGARLLVDAARALKAEGGWSFVAYGTPGDVDESGVIDRRPAVSNADARTVMADADLVVVPSVYPEALPRTCLEAQVVGTPVVGTPNAGIPEAIAPTGGVIARGVHAVALAEALRAARARLEVGGFDMAAAASWVQRTHGIDAVRARVLSRLRPEDA